MEDMKMTILGSKWVIAIIALVVMFLVMYLLGRKSVHAELIIPATPGEVWSVLMDVPGYKEWNLVLVPIEGEFKKGSKLKYKMSSPDGTTTEVKSSIVEIIEEKKLNQRGGIPGIMTFNHTWLLELVEEGTKVTQYEEYRGIGVLFWDPSWYESAYQRAIEALRDYVIQQESLSNDIKGESNE
jgi:hypothetical protein